MQKEILTVEFRYQDVPKDEYLVDYVTKRITIGIYDTLEEAVSVGNQVIQILAEKFKVRPEDDNFKLVFLFGNPKRLVSNCFYPTRGIQFFANITPLKFDNLSDTIEEAFKAADRYEKYKKEINE